MKIEIDDNFAPSKIVCVGRNYADHARELGNEVPAEPLLFLKAPSSLLRPKGGTARVSEWNELDKGPTSLPPAHAGGSAIVIPQYSQQVEHEGELAVVIGDVCKNLPEEADLSQYILGYTCLNDVTARDLQKKDGQFTRAKSFDTFCPIGPWIETELDVSDIRVVCRVNGEVRQDGRTSQMVFGVGYLVRYISNMMTLLPGDLIATGTPSGVSRLKAGDVCEVEIEGIGVLRNGVAQARA